MLKGALKDSANILASANYYPMRMIVDFSEKDPDVVKEMFLNLFDESKKLYDRIKFFIEKSDVLLNKYHVGKKHYQDMHVISTYLCFKYPNKYYLFKSTVDKKALNYINIDISDNDKIIELVNYCDDIAVLQQQWCDLVECLGDQEDLGYCDQCGDFITKYTLNI
jgi:5-methylcytosine-specific restriction protein B